MIKNLALITLATTISGCTGFQAMPNSIASSSTSGTSTPTILPTPTPTPPGNTLPPSPQPPVIVTLVCIPNTQQNCQTGNAMGSQTCNTSGSAWGACGNFTNCQTGYDLQGGQCVSVQWPQNPALTAKQTAPQMNATYVSLSGVAAMIENSQQNSWSLYSVTSNNGVNLDVMDVVQTHNPTYPYVAVSHSDKSPQAGTFCVNLTYSTNLHDWNWLGTLECGASQATIRMLQDGSFLVAYEYNPSTTHAWPRVRYYSDLNALASNNPAVVSDAPGSPGADYTGTPSFRQINYSGGGWNGLSFELTDHFYLSSNNADLEGFQTWNIGSAAAWNINDDWMNLVIPLNSIIHGLGFGEIGGRDSFDIGGNRYFIVEASDVVNDLNGFRLNLIQEGSNASVKLNLRSPSGGVAFANPKISFLTLPNGQPALVGTSFVFDGGGSHFFAYPLPVLPGGSYSLSCNSCSISGSTVSCSCGNTSGGFQNSALDLSTCARTDQVGNINGNLTCQ